jgi:hypothetical protein
LFNKISNFSSSSCDKNSFIGLFSSFILSNASNL